MRDDTDFFRLAVHWTERVCFFVSSHIPPCFDEALRRVNADTIRRAHAVAPVAAVEVEYSPWSLDIEKNDVLATCKELGIAIIAYRSVASTEFPPSPLADPVLLRTARWVRASSPARSRVLPTSLKVTTGTTSTGSSRRTLPRTSCWSTSSARSRSARASRPLNSLLPGFLRSGRASSPFPGL